MRGSAFVVPLLAVLAGCDHASRWGGPWPAPAERTMGEDRAPTPYTAEQIRAACPEGRRSTFRIEVPDSKPYEQVFSFRNVDEAGCTFAVRVRALDGTEMRRPRESRATWRGLQSHASYPAAQTMIDRETQHLPTGRYRCMRYTIAAPPDADGPLTRAWFARELPGPPVRYEQYFRGELTLRMTLVRQEVVPSGDA